MRDKKPKLRYLRFRRTLPDLSGRVAVVTGANGGLGYETVRGLLALHCRVILACRDENKGRKALTRLLNEFPDGSLDLLPLDLSRSASIAEFAERLALIAPQIDVFVHCAGIYYPKMTRTPDGLPATVGINYVGTVALAKQTEKLLSPDGRAVFVTSLVDKKGSVKTDPVSDDQPSGYLAYARSKFLLSGYVLKKSAEPTPDSPLFVAAHPGIAKTPLLAKEKTGPRPLWSRWGHAMLYPFTHSPEKASLSVLCAAAGKVESGDLIAPRGLFHVWGYPKKISFPRNVRDAVKQRPEWFE